MADYTLQPIAESFVNYVKTKVNVTVVELALVKKDPYVYSVEEENARKNAREFMVRLPGGTELEALCKLLTDLAQYITTGNKLFWVVPPETETVRSESGSTALAYARLFVAAETTTTALNIAQEAT